MTRDEDVRHLLERATIEPTQSEREAILAAAEPILADHARRAERRTGVRDRITRIAAAWTSRRRWVLAAGLVAVVLAVLLVPRPDTRDPRSAPLRTWAEHMREDPGRPFPLASASFGRAY